MPEDRASLKELDRWVSYLMQCQQLPEGQVKTLCEKVGYQHNSFYSVTQQGVILITENYRQVTVNYRQILFTDNRQEILMHTDNIPTNTNYRQQAV